MSPRITRMPANAEGPDHGWQDQFFGQEDRMGRRIRRGHYDIGNKYHKIFLCALRVLCGQSHRTQSLKLTNLNLKTSPPSAFSLVELLVVVAILAVLAVAGVAALGDRKSVKARGGAELMDALFTQARSHAVMKRTGTRVVVQTKYRSDKPEDYLRAVAVFDQSAGGWTTQVTPWKRLPEGVFFSEERSGKDGPMSVSVPGRTVDCAYFEFDSRGQRSGHAKVVVEEGTQVDGTFTGRGVEGAHGFMVYPMGQRVFMEMKKIAEEPEE